MQYNCEIPELRSLVKTVILFFFKVFYHIHYIVKYVIAQVLTAQVMDKEDQDLSPSLIKAETVELLQLCDGKQCT